MLSITIPLIILIISSAYALTPCAHAQLTTSNTAKGIAIISNVAGINLGNQTITSTLAVAGSYLGALPNENIRYSLTGFEGSMEIQDTFTNGSLQIMDVLENTPSLLIPALPTSIALGGNESYALVEMAKAFLNNYKSYSANPLYSQLASTLNNANPTRNSTTTFGNINFNINTISGNSAVGNSTAFTWSYTSNGVNADCKCVSLTYENDYLKSFIDTWNLYPIGSTTINLSKQQAENIAMQNAKTCTWTISSGNKEQVINNFNITEPVIELLEFAPAGTASNARSSDPLTLYPMWSIGVGLDKWYPGNTYGIGINIWADTGQIRDKGAEFSTLPPPAGVAVATIAESSIPTVNNQTSHNTSGFNIFPTFWIVLAAFVSTILSIPVWLSRKRSLPSSLRLPKLRIRLITVAMLCILIIGTALLVPAAHAGSALIWGDDSNVQGNFHSNNEITNQTMVATYITDLFQSAGYAYTNNMQGVGTTPQEVQAYVPYVNQGWPPTATIWFDSGCGMPNSASQPILQQIPNWQNYENEFHYSVSGTYATLNNPSGDVFDYQISSLTHENYFTWISACQSSNTTTCTSGSWTYGPNPGGSGAPIGMPYAWTHYLTTSSPTSNPPAGYMSSNGYSYADSGANCFIGFPWGSASLSQETPHAVNPYYPYVTYCLFVSDFYYAALSLHDTVDQALDYASDNCWNENFGLSTLYSGFTAYWPQGGGFGNQCTLTVEGNGNMYLYTGSPDYVSTPSISGPNSGVINTQYTFTASATDPCGYALTYTYNYGDGSGWTNQNTHIYSSDGIYTVTVKAQSSTGLSSQSSTAITIGPTYQTQVNVYLTLNGNTWYYDETGYINEPAGQNYLNFGGGLQFVQAYDYYDGTLHTTNPDWYNLGTGTTINVGYFY